MQKEDNCGTVKKVRPYDSYRWNPIWKQPENYSTYYNYEVDKQCRVPIRSREEIRKELGIM